MKRLYFIIIFLGCFQISNGQQSKKYIGLYIKPSVGLQANFSSNSGIQITNNSIYTNQSSDVVSVGLGGNYDVSIGYSNKKKYFAEVGFGVYSIGHSHHTPKYGTFHANSYRNVFVRLNYYQVPVRVGRSYSIGKLSLSPYLGANILVDLIGFQKGKTDGPHNLKMKKEGEDKGYYYLLPHKVNVFAILFNPGVAVSYPVSRKIEIFTALNLTLGYRIIIDSGILMYQEQSSGTVSNNGFSTNKGDAVGLSVGFKYSPFKRK